MLGPQLESLPPVLQESIFHIAAKQQSAKQNRRVNSIASVSSDSALIDSMPVNTWVFKGTAAFEYDADGYLTSEKYYNGYFATPTTYVTSEFDELGQFKNTVWRAWNTTIAGYDTLYLDTLIYDSHNNLTRQVHYESDGSRMLKNNETFIENTYNTQGFLVRLMVYSFDDTGGISKVISDYSELGPNGETRRTIQKNEQGGVLNPDSTAILTNTFHVWVQGGIGNFNFPDSTYYFSGRDNTWTAKSFYKWIYGAYNSNIEYISVFRNGIARLESRSTTTYNSHGHLTQNIGEDYLADGSLVFANKSDMVYKFNPDGSMAGYIYAYTNSDNPVTDSIYRFTYFGHRGVSGLQSGQNMSAKAVPYPNPFSAQLEISILAGLHADAYFISDISGRRLKQGQLFISSGIAQIPASDLNAGVYLLGLSSKGQLFQTLKICKTAQ